MTYKIFKMTKMYFTILILLTVTISFIVVDKAEAVSFSNIGWAPSRLEVTLDGTPVVMNRNYISYWTGSSWSKSSISFPSYGCPQYGISTTIIDDKGRMWYSGTYDDNPEIYTTGFVTITGNATRVNSKHYIEFVKNSNTGIIYAVDSTGCVDYISEDTLVSVTTSIPTGKADSECLAIDSNGTIWVGGVQKLYHWNGSSWITVSTPLIRETWAEANLEFAGDGTLYVQQSYNSLDDCWATFKNGVWNYRVGGPPFSSHQKIDVGPDGKIWGISENYRYCLAYYDDESDSIVQTIPWSYTISNFSIDSTGVVWVNSGSVCGAYIGGSWLTDTSGFTEKFIQETLKAAQTANTNAQTAATNADNANTNASNAYLQAKWAADVVTNGVNSNGKSLAATYDKANSSNANTAYIRNTQFPELQNKTDTTVNQTVWNGKSAAEWAYLASLNANVDNMPPTLECGWDNSATITNSSGQATLWAIASDNISVPSSITLAYSLNGISYTNFSGEQVTLTLSSSPKFRTIYVKATDAAGKSTVKTLTIFVQ